MVTWKRAFTIVELLIVILCISLMSGVLFTILKSGTDASLRGMLKVDTVLEARTVIQQIHQDLKNACFPIPSGGSIPQEFLDPAKILQVQGSHPEKTFSFFTFPLHGEIEGYLGPPGDPFSQDHVTYRLSKVVYSLGPGEETQGQTSFLTLTRTEFFHPDHPLAQTFPAGQKKILSKRVNFFLINLKKFPLKRSKKEDDSNPINGQTYFWITLQLVESYPKTEDQRPSSEGSWIHPNAHLIVADFHDVVYSEFFNQLANRSPSNRNWYADFAGPQGPE